MWVRSACECSLRLIRMISKWSPRLLWVCSDNSGKKCESGGNIDMSQKVDCSTIWEALQTQKSNQTFDNDPKLYRSCGLFCTLTETQTKRFQKLDVWWELKIIMTGFKSKSLEHLWLLSNQKIACSKLWCQSSLRFSILRLHVPQHQCQLFHWSQCHILFLSDPGIPGVRSMGPGFMLLCVTQCLNFERHCAMFELWTAQNHSGQFACKEGRYQPHW